MYSLKWQNTLETIILDARKMPVLGPRFSPPEQQNKGPYYGLCEIKIPFTVKYPE